MPANIAVICIIKNTAKVIPINSAENLVLSLTNSLNPIRSMPLYFMLHLLLLLGSERSTSPLLMLLTMRRCPDSAVPLPADMRYSSHDIARQPSILPGSQLSPHDNWPATT